MTALSPLAQQILAIALAPPGHCPLSVALAVMAEEPAQKRCPDCVYGTGSDHLRIACPLHKSVEGVGGRRPAVTRESAVEAARKRSVERKQRQAQRDRAVREMLAAGKSWADIRRRLHVGYATIGKLKARSAA